MKNLKKILCLVLCLAVVLTMVFTFVACDRELTEEEKEKLRTELIADAAPDFTRAETTIEMADESSGIKSQMSITWDMGNANPNAKAAPVFNADIIFLQYNLDDSAPVNVNVAFIRGDYVYGKQLNLEIKGSDKIAAVKNKMSELTNNLEKISVEELLAQISTETGTDLGALTNVTLPNAGNAVGAQIVKALLSEYFTYVTVSDGGYSLSFDFNKVADAIWNIVYSLAETIDANKDVSIDTLYKDAFVAAAIQEIPLTATELETAINQSIAEANKQLPTEQQLSYTALVAEQDETLYHYLGRYLELRADGTKTVGNLTIGDLLCKLYNTSTAPDLTDKMDEQKIQILSTAKEMLKQFKFELNFTKDKMFDGITIGITGIMNINIKPLQSVSLAEIAE